jgi:hypothetical protein
MHTTLGSTYYYGKADDFKGQLWEFQDKEGRHNPCYLRIVASLPILIAVSASTVITTLPPTYLSIRHGLVLGLGFFYLIVSPVLTFSLRRSFDLTAVRIKNALAAFVATGVLIVASCGLFFNNCRGWEPVYPRNLGIALHPQRLFDSNVQIWFPFAAGLCLSLQILLWYFVKKMCTSGLNVMKLSWVFAA